MLNTGQTNSSANSARKTSNLRSIPIIHIKIYIYVFGNIQEVYIVIRIQVQNFFLYHFQNMYKNQQLQIAR